MLTVMTWRRGVLEVLCLSGSLGLTSESLLMCPGNGRVVEIISAPLSQLFKMGTKTTRALPPNKPFSLEPQTLHPWAV